MRTSGKASELGLILIPLLVATGLVALFVGVDVPRTLYGVDQAIRSVIVTIIDAIRSLF